MAHVQLGYRKSKNGCSLCKKRRVKCDENQPCSSCKKHHVRCSLLDTGEVTNIGMRAPLSARAARRKATDSITSSSHSATSDAPQLTAVNTDADAWMTDLELMHHYTTVTCGTIPAPRGTEHVLRDDIPRLGLRFSYLMHQLLAVSALHIAYVSPDSDSSKKYLSRASHHQAIAISGMRPALSKPITEGTSRALFAASAFLMVGTFATNRGLGPTSPDVCEVSHRCPMDGILETFSVVRGMGAIREATSKELQRNLVGDLFGTQPQSTSCESLRVVEGRLYLLQALVMADETLDDGLKHAVCAGIGSLLAFMETKSSVTIMARKELSVVFGWPWTVSDELLGLLRKRSPAALTMFLYYCIVMQTLEADYWFLEGWTARLGIVVAMSLRGSRWEEVAQWPLLQLKVPKTRSS